MTEPLLYDYSRCHDHVCPERDVCLRYLRRHTATEMTSHVATFRVAKLTCTHLIHA